MSQRPEPAGLRVLVVDDELPVREELSYLLARDPRVVDVHVSGSGADALRQIERGDIDVVFLDIAMPGLTGLELARVLAQFKVSPRVVFVTAHDAHAVEAFEVNAVDYLLKPVREERLTESVRRVVEAGDHQVPVDDHDEIIPVELAGVTRFVRRSDVRYAEAQGDYVRLHTSDGSHLLRAPLSALEERWADAGFLRIHRSLLVSLPHVTELRVDQGRCSVVVADDELQVSRRHTAELRDVLVRRAKPADEPA